MTKRSSQISLSDNSRKYSGGKNHYGSMTSNDSARRNQLLITHRLDSAVLEQGPRLGYSMFSHFYCIVASETQRTEAGFQLDVGVSLLL